MQNALALLEFGSVAVGIKAVDSMLKRSPIALLRCGTVHPGRYLALVGGSVASTEEAHLEGGRIGAGEHALLDEVLLPDPHPLLTGAVAGQRSKPEAEAVGVLEISTSAGLLKAVDRALKAVPVGLTELRLADDLGGRALAILDGTLEDVQEALEIARESAGPCAEVLGATVMPRLEETLRRVLAAGTGFRECGPVVPDGAEKVRD